MENSIKFSILIPTKNRLDLLRHAVASVLNQTYANWELIISDNCSFEDIKSYTDSLADERIVYYRQPKPVSVADNWNAANSMAQGDYIIMLGDDDALVPNALDILKKYIIDGYPQVISFMAYHYLQPGVDPKDVEGDVRVSQPMPLDSTKEAILPLEWRRDIVRRCCAFELAIGYNMQYYCYSKEMVEIVEKYGEFYAPPYPDYYTACMCLVLAEKFVNIPQIITIIGITPKSYGYYYRNNNEKDGMTFHGEDDYRLHAPVSVRDKLCSVDEMHTAALVTFARFVERIGFFETNLEGYYKAVIRREIQYNGLDKIYSLIAEEMAPHIDKETQDLLMEYARLCMISNQASRNVSFDTISELLGNLAIVEGVMLARNGETYGDIDTWLAKIGIRNVKAYAKGRSIRIWGAYTRGNYLKTKIEQAGLMVSGFIDREPKKAYAGVEVLCPEDALNVQKDEYIMLPLIHKYDDIIGFLNRYGYKSIEDYMYFSE